MTKHSYELKKKIVEEYLCGKTSYQVLVMKYQIEKSVLRLWISSYKNCDDEGLIRFRNNHAYSVEFRLEAIIRYETSECSYQQLAFELGLTNPSMIINWRRQYREKGIKGLSSHRRGRPVTKKDDHNQPPETVKKSKPVDASIREALENRIRESEVENRKLTVQKMLWEQLRSLEKEEVMDKRRRLSPNSENDSN